MRRIFLSFFVLLLAFSLTTSGQTRDVISPQKVTQQPLIDGILDEEVWRSGKGITGFMTFIPDYGREMPFKTTVWAAYDEENLYYAFRCDDPEPSRIKVSVDSRDKIRDRKSVV